MREEILRFLREIDDALFERTGGVERLDFYMIGKAALILFHDVGRGSATTRDVDVIQFSANAEPLLQLALELFGAGAQPGTGHTLYLEAVNAGLPPMPGAFRSRCRPFEEETYRVLRVHQPEVHDLAVSKLNRFAPKDRQDIRELCDRGLLRREDLESAFTSAYWTMAGDNEDPVYERGSDALRRVIAYLEGETPGL